MVAFSLYSGPALPYARARLIAGGITREEYRRRFGMCDAAISAFSKRDAAQALEREAKAVVLPREPSRRNRYLDANGRLIGQALLVLLRTFPRGATVDELVIASNVGKLQVRNKLQTLRNLGKVEPVGKARMVSGGPCTVWKAVTAKAEA